MVKVGQNKASGLFAVSHMTAEEFAKVRVALNLPELNPVAPVAPVVETPTEVSA